MLKMIFFTVRASALSQEGARFRLGDFVVVAVYRFSFISATAVSVCLLAQFCCRVARWIGSNVVCANCMFQWLIFQAPGCPVPNQNFRKKTKQNIILTGTLAHLCLLDSRSFILSRLRAEKWIIGRRRRKRNPPPSISSPSPRVYDYDVCCFRTKFFAQHILGAKSFFFQRR